MYKPLADSTLQRMKKTEIIELLRIAEHNAKVAQEYVDQQAKNLKDWAPVVHGRWEEADWVEPGFHGFGTIRTPKAALRCSNCKNCFKKELLWKDNYCPNCGAKMDMRDTVNNNANKEIG